MWRLPSAPLAIMMAQRPSWAVRIQRQDLTIWVPYLAYVGVQHLRDYDAYQLTSRCILDAGAHLDT